MKFVLFLSCSCLSGFNGQRCQQTHHSFSGGYTVYPPLAQCEASTTSIEFITVEKHGLLFYNGPVDKLAVDQPKDFISLELKGGYPLLYINHGTGTVKLQLDGKGKDGITRMKKLNDGSWHRIDIRRKGQVGCWIYYTNFFLTNVCWLLVKRYCLVSNKNSYEFF